MTPDQEKKHAEVCECIGLLKTLHDDAIGPRHTKASNAFYITIDALEILRNRLAKGDAP